MLEFNLASMAAVRPGVTLRPHVKAFKSTALARLMAEQYGHRGFCCATLRELEGMADAGLGDDLLLANETLDGERLAKLATRNDARVTVAVDSIGTIEVAAQAAVREVLIDVEVGLPRCGCRPADAGRLAEVARRRGLTVRGVMGYEGQCQDWGDTQRRRAEVERSMALLAAAHRMVGGDMISAGGTGTHAMNDLATEIQAGSYALMDTHYADLGDLGFRTALRVLATVVSVRPGPAGWYVADAGLKAFAMDHGNPTAETGDVFFCSDEHTTVSAEPDLGVAIGDRVTFLPAPTRPSPSIPACTWLTGRMWSTPGRSTCATGERVETFAPSLRQHRSGRRGPVTWANLPSRRGARHPVRGKERPIPVGAEPGAESEIGTLCPILGQFRGCEQSLVDRVGDFGLGPLGRCDDGERRIDPEFLHCPVPEWRQSPTGSEAQYQLQTVQQGSIGTRFQILLQGHVRTFQIELEALDAEGRNRSCVAGAGGGSNRRGRPHHGRGRLSPPGVLDSRCRHGRSAGRREKKYR